MTALAALAAAACSPQSDNIVHDGPKGNLIAQNRQPVLDTCAVAHRPERFDGQRVRLRAIVVQEIESAYLTLPHCMLRRWDGKVWIDDSKGWGFSDVDSAVMEARRRSTATRTLAAEAEFEGIVRAHRRPVPMNEIRPASEFMAMFEVENVDHVRLVEIPVVQRP